MIRNWKQWTAGIGLFTLLATGTTWAATSPKATPSPDAQRFVNVMMQVKQYYVQPVDDHDLFENAIRGMVGRLDPHSAFLSADDIKQLNQATSGQFAGIGIEMAPDHGLIKVISPLDNSPAMRAGLKPGDYIVRIGDALVEGMSLKDVADNIRGKPGTQLKLTVLRPGQQPFQVKVTREIIKTQNLKAQLYDEHIAYVRIAQFQEKTPQELLQSMRNLQQRSHHQLRALILDLRNNPGGLLQSSAQVSDLFLDSRKLGKNTLIVYAKDRQGQVGLKAYATPGDWLDGMPMIVLINAGSASASEIVAGALQDHRRATVLGTHSFGKGSVQTVIPVGPESAIKLTTHLYYTPAGRRIQAQGIAPNVVVKDMQLVKQSSKPNIDPVLEAQLKGHIKGNANNTGTQAVASEDVTMVYKDYQLFQAINLAKGLSIMQTSNTQSAATCKALAPDGPKKM